MLRYKIGTKIGLGFGVILVLMGLLVALSYLQLKHGSEAFQELFDTLDLQADASARVKSLTIDLALLTPTGADYSAAYADIYRKKETALGSALEELRKSVAGKKELETKVASGWAAFEDQKAVFDAFLESSRNSEAANIPSASAPRRM